MIDLTRFLLFPNKVTHIIFLRLKIIIKRVIL